MKNREHLSRLFALALDPGLEEARQLDFSDIPNGKWRIGPYEILREIGRGLHGIVYQARQPHSNRLVAVKRLYSSVKTGILARRPTSLMHPHILSVDDFDRGQNGPPYISMRLVGGGNLARHPIQNQQHAAGILLKISRALQFAHEKGVTHRHLTPTNILFDRLGEPLLSDFAQAHLPKCSRKQARTFDIQSLGKIFGHMLSSQGDSLPQTTPDTSRATTYNLALETICARCLEPNPAIRYQQAGEVADDLQRWLDDAPIQPLPCLSTSCCWEKLRHFLPTG